MGIIHGLLAKVMYPTPDESTFVEEMELDNSTVPDNDDNKAANQRPPEMIEPQAAKPKPRPRRRK